MAKVAASADQKAIALLTIDSVWTATDGYTDEIHEEGIPAAKRGHRFTASELWRNLGVWCVYEILRNHRE